MGDRTLVGTSICLFVQILIYSHRLGFRSTKKEKGSYSWLGFGDGTGGDHMVKTSFFRSITYLPQVWRHTCVFIDFLEGRTAFFENGQKLFEKTGVKVGRAVCKEV